MDILQDRSFIFAQKVLSVLGFSPLQSHKERFPRTCIVGFSLIYATLAQLCQLFTVDFNLRSIILVLQLFLPCISIVNIYYTTILHFVTVQKCFFWLIQDCQQLRDEIELKIMQKHINESKLFAMICGSTFYLYTSLSTLPSILRIIISTNEVEGTRDRYPVFSCFDYFLGQEHYYYPVVIFQILTAVLTITAAISCYSLYFWIIQHSCAHLSIIKDKLQRPFIENHYNDIVMVIPNDRSHWIIDIIQHLNRTVQLVALLNKISENCYLFQMSLVFVHVVIDLLCLFQMPSLLKHTEDMNDAFVFLLFLATTLIPPYFHCYIGQRLMDYSVDVYNEACLIPIHEISLKTQKLLLTMLTMNAKPCVVSIGKVFVLSHEFFSNLVRTSFSFAMVLHSMQSM